MLGGIIHEQYAYMDSMQSLMILAGRCNVGTKVESDSAHREEEERLRREVDLLQSYAELVRGLSGYVGGLLLLAGTPETKAIRAAHLKGLQACNNAADMGALFASPSISSSTQHTVKTLCVFVPQACKSGGTSPGWTSNSSGNNGRRSSGPDQQAHMRAGGTSARADNANSLQLSSHLEEPVRGRQSSEGIGRGSPRLSRSLSPNSARRHVSTSLQTQTPIHTRRGGDLSLGRAASERHLQSVRATADERQEPTSLVSDILTMFAGRDSSLANNNVYIEGSVLIRSANNLSEDICSFARGGLRVWFPLLILDAPRQVATLRILACLITSSARVYSEFESAGVSSVVLYCLYVTPLLSSEASLQVLFDLAVTVQSPMLHHVSSQHQVRSESIQRADFLRLSVDVATASPCNIQLAMCTVEWLIGVCDDSLENVGKVLEAVGVVPFLIMLSLWRQCEDMQLLEAGSSLVEEREGEDAPHLLSEYTIRMPCAPLTDIETTSLVDSSRGVFPDSVYTEQPRKLARLQVTLARLLKLMITGCNGELPPVRVPVATQSPTGFNVSHMQSLLNFIAFAME